MNTKIIKNKKKGVKMGKWLLLAIVPLLIFSSCSNDRNDITGSVKKKDPKVSIDFSGTSKVGEAQTRSFTITPEIKGAEASRSYNAKLNYLSRDGQTIQVRFALIAVSPNGVIQNRDSFAANAIVKVTDKEKNEAELEFPKQKIYLKKSTVDDKQTKWYVSGIIGARGDFNQDYGIEFSQTQNTTTYSIQGGKITGSPITDYTGISAYSGEQNGRVQVYDVPIICPWTEVNRHNLEAQQSFRLKTTFKPQGMLIAFNIKSELHDAAILTDLEITTNAFTSNVTFDFGAFAKGQTPTAINNGKSMNIGGYHSDFGYINTYKIANVEVDPNHPTQIYIWVMPMNGGGNLEGHTTAASGANGVIVIRTKAISKASVTNKTIKPTSDGRYIESIPYSPIEQIITNVASHIQNGNSLTINTKLQSDLMMTQYVQADKSRSGTGILEVYNPTNHDIDLSQYNIIRIEGEYYNKYYYFTTQVLTSQKTNLDYAVLQNLYIATNNSPTYNYEGDIVHNNWNTTNRYKELYGTTQSKMLKPGKCALFFAGAYFDSTPKDVLNNLTGSETLNSEITKNTTHNDCQIALAVDNGWNKNAPGSDRDAGTMQKEIQQGFLLIKGKVNAYKNIDVLGPGPNELSGNTDQFTLYSGNSGTNKNNGNPLVWVRNEYALYPNLYFMKHSYEVPAFNGSGKTYNFSKEGSEWYVETDFSSKNIKLGRRYLDTKK